MSTSQYPLHCVRTLLCVAACSATWTARAETDFTVALAFNTSVQQANLHELNEALAASGHAPLRERDILPGMGIVGSFDRLRFGWSIGMGFSRELSHEATGWTGDVYQLQSFADAGYDIFRSDGWAIAGHGGVGIAKFSLDAMPSHPPFSPDAFDPAGDETSLEQSSGLVRAALGVTYSPELVTPSYPQERTKVEGLIVLFDLRAGFQQVFVAGDWHDMYGDAALGSSPRVDLSGPFVMFTVAVGGGNVDFGAAKDVCGPAPAHADWKAKGLSCVPACFERFGDCDGDPETGCEASFDTDPRHCGGCDKACDLFHAQSDCRQTKCVPRACESGWGDCDGIPENGCESGFATSRDHCGGCRNRCPDDEECRGGVCGVAPAVEIAE